MSNHADWEPNDERLGLMTGYRWIHDPRTVLFVLARYKFVSRMLDGYDKVLEVGCADGFGSRLVRQSVKSLTALDIDGQMIEDARNRQSEKWHINFVHGDMASLGANKFDALYCLDVLEHVDPDDEPAFLTQAAQLAPFVIIGMPSAESQLYASQFSRENHVNCQSAPELKASMKKCFKHVFTFSMNDEVVHTGFHKMAHYIFALGVN